MPDPDMTQGDALPAPLAVRPLTAENAADKQAYLGSLPRGRDIWVFGYGSLMWNPGFDFLEKRPALLRGYHRAFCIYSEHYRGTRERPGLVLGLDRGGSCRGIAFRVAQTAARDVLGYLWDREMVTSVYAPRTVAPWIDGCRIDAEAFVVARKHIQYAGRLDDAAAAGIIRQGVGISGPNRDYLENTVRHLDALGIRDCPLHRLLRSIERMEADEAAARD